MSSVLTGSRVLRQDQSFVNTVFVWLPVAVMLVVIVRESTEGFSGLHTSAWLRPLWQGVFGPMEDSRWEWTHHLIRKTGHFVGYGTLGLCWLRGWLLTWMDRFRRRAAAAWRGWSLTMAIWCTAMVASCDELHQTWLPDRTGVMQDVLLDTTGALICCGLVAMFWWRERVREAAFTHQAPN